MPYVIIRKTARDRAEAAQAAGLSRRYQGLARSEDEALELSLRNGDRPDKPLAFDDKGQADREQAEHAGVSRDAWDKMQHERAKR